jgi:ribonuclease HI
VNRGTIQGDTLSPLLFLVAIDPLLRWLQQGGRGYRCGSSPAEDQHTCAAIGYADDLTILTDDIAEVKTQVKKIELFSQWSSLRLSPQKCALTGILHKTGKVLHRADKQRNESPTDWERLQPILQDVLIDGHPVTLKRADEPIKYLGVLLTMTQSWDQQVDAVVADMNRNYELLNRTQLGQVHKQAIEESNILGSVKYAMDVLHLTETQMERIEDARARGIKKLLKLPNSTDGKFCRLPRHNGGCGFKQLAPIISQIAAEALVQDLNCPGPTGHLARHLLRYQMKEKKLTSLRGNTTAWLQGHSRQALSLHQAARAAENGLIIDWRGGADTVLTGDDLYDMVNTANGLLKRGTSAILLDNDILKPLWSVDIRFLKPLCDTSNTDCHLLKLSEFDEHFPGSGDDVKTAYMRLTRFMCAPVGSVDLDDVVFEDLPCAWRKLPNVLAGGLIVGDNTRTPAAQPESPGIANTDATSKTQRQLRTACMSLRPQRVTKCTESPDGARQITFEWLPTQRRSREELQSINACSFMAIDYPSSMELDNSRKCNLDRYGEDYGMATIDTCKFADVTWQDSTLSLEDAVRYWPQQVKAYFDRPDVASIPGGIPGLISTQWNVDLRAPKRSHCIGHCDANVRVHPEEVNPDRDIVPPDDGLPKVELTTSEPPEANIYTGSGHYVATTCQTGITDLMKLHQATAPETPSGEAALQDIITLYNRNRVKRTDNEKQMIEMSSHRWRLCPQLLSDIASACNTHFEWFSSPLDRNPAIPAYATDSAADAPFGALHNAYAHKWTGSGYFHPPHGQICAQKALRWAVSSTFESKPTFNIGVLVCPPGAKLKLIEHERVQVLLHLNHRQHEPPLTEPTWYTNMRMQYKMPKTWELRIIAVANDAGLSKYADSFALRGALRAAAAPHRYGWPDDIVQDLRSNPAPGSPMPITKAFQKAAPPPEPAAQAETTTSFEMPDQVLTHAPKHRFDDKDHHWYTDGSKSRNKKLTAAVVKGLEDSGADKNIRVTFPDDSHDLRLHTSVMAEHAALATAVREAPADQPITLFTDSLTSIWNIKGMLENPERYRNHKHQLALSEIAQTLRTKQISIRKVRAHSGIAGNELADGIAAGKVTCGQTETYEDNGEACRGLAWILYRNRSQQGTEGPQEWAVNDLTAHPLRVANAEYNDKQWHEGEDSHHRCHRQVVQSARGRN